MEQGPEQRPEGRLFDRKAPGQAEHGQEDDAIVDGRFTGQRRRERLTNDRRNVDVAGGTANVGERIALEGRSDRHVPESGGSDIHHRLRSEHDRRVIHIRLLESADGPRQRSVPVEQQDVSGSQREGSFSG